MRPNVFVSYIVLFVSDIKLFSIENMEESAESSMKCIFCKKSRDKINLFSIETLKKCQTILKHRIIHNLKFKDVVLPDDLYESGYHRECYKCFTALPKKYYSAISEKSKNDKKKFIGYC